MKRERHWAQKGSDSFEKRRSSRRSKETLAISGDEYGAIEALEQEQDELREKEAQQEDDWASLKEQESNSESSSREPQHNRSTSKRIEMN